MVLCIALDVQVKLVAKVCVLPGQAQVDELGSGGSGTLRPDDCGGRGHRGELTVRVRG